MVEPKERRQPVVTRWGWQAVALIPLLLGFGLRLQYVMGAEPFVDEPTTLLVAQAIARSAVPTLPSGLFYGNDLPFSYLAGGLVALFGARLEVVRMVSLAASVITLGLVYLAGARLYPRGTVEQEDTGLSWTGFWAALLLALSPEAITWGGRARAYALLGLFAFLAVWLFYAGLAEGRDGLRRAGWLILLVGVFVHPEAALLLPAFFLGAMLLKGWRWWIQPGRLAELVLALGATGVRYWLQLALARGQLSGVETIVGTRPPLELAGDWLFRLQGVAPFFVARQRLTWTILALLALVVALHARVRKRQACAAQPTLFFSVCLWLVPAGMVLFLGSTYQSPRYLTMLLPVFALLAGAGLDWVVACIARLARADRWRIGVVVLVAAMLVIATLPGAIAAASSKEKGFRSALEYVAQHWQPGDRVATVAPAYSKLVLDRSDYFTLGLDYEEFVYVADNGQWLDRWMGSPLVRSAEELASVLDGGGRLWFVSDEGRLRKRFAPAFAQMVWQRMELATKTGQVMVFVSREAPKPATSKSVATVFGGQVALVGYDLGSSTQRPANSSWGEVAIEPGQALPLTLYWQAVAPVTEEYTVFVHLLGLDGQLYGQDDGPPLGGIQPMTHWQVAETLPDRRTLDLPADLKGGRYRLDVGLYELDSGDRLHIVEGAGQSLAQALTIDYVQVLAPVQSLPSPEQSIQLDFVGDGDRIRLLGYTLQESTARPGGRLPLTLHWQAVNPIGTEYTVFVHLLDEQDQIRGQGDGPPVGGFYPTMFWDAGEIVADEREVSVDPDAPAGAYWLAVGLYELSTGRRLSTGDGDRVLLGEVRVE